MFCIFAQNEATMQSTIICLFIFISMGLASSLSIVKSVGIVLASSQLVVLGSRASRRRRRRLARRRVELIRSLACEYTNRLFGDTCPVPSYKPLEYQAELWAFHKAHCIPQEQIYSIEGLFVFAFMIILFILMMCLGAR